MELEQYTDEMTTTSGKELFDEYWEQKMHWEAEPAVRPDVIVDHVCRFCGAGSVLEVGCGKGAYALDLLARGFDVQGVDIAKRPVEYLQGMVSDRFNVADVRALPFKDNQFKTVIAINVLQYIPLEDLDVVIRELYRVSERYVYIQVLNHECQPDNYSFCHRSASWWQELFFENSFRLHPLSVFEDTIGNREVPLTFEKIPDVHLCGRLKALTEEDWLVSSMKFRKASCLMYARLVSSFITPNGTVLDLHCGPGASSYVFANNAVKYPNRVIGVETGKDGVEYAKKVYQKHNLEYWTAEVGLKCLQPLDGSVDTAVVLNEVHTSQLGAEAIGAIVNTLIPGGRLIIAVDEASPWDELKRHLLVEQLFQYEEGDLVELERDSESISNAGIAVLIKNPHLPSSRAYEETVFPYRGKGETPNPIAYARDYENPWIVHTLIHNGLRVRSNDLLEQLAEETLLRSGIQSPDYGGALCVLIYRHLEKKKMPGGLLGKVEEYLSYKAESAHGIRWHVSICFALGSYFLVKGKHDEAVAYFERCRSMDSLQFSPHLATKTSEAYFYLGWIAYLRRDIKQAKRHWKEGLAFCERLLDCSMRDILIDPDMPHLFEIGDGMREYVLTLDNLTRCANGIHFAGLEEPTERIDLQRIWLGFKQFRDELDKRTAALNDCHVELKRRTELLHIRTDMLSDRNEKLADRSKKLVERNEQLERRTEQLETVSHSRELILENLSKAEGYIQDYVKLTAEHNREKQSLIAAMMARHLQTSKAKKVFIFGKGEFGQTILKFCSNHHVAVEGFFDSNVSREGEKVSGKPCHSVSKINERKPGVIVVGTLAYAREVIEKINNVSKNDRVTILYYDSDAYNVTTVNEYHEL